MEIKVIKRHGKNTGDEKEEITIEIVGKIVVYGDENLAEFSDEIQSAVDQYAI